MEHKIYSVSIITQAGGKTYYAGGSTDNHQTIQKIVQVSLHFQGDPYDHYVGFDKDGKMLFTINCLVPCEVVYM